LLFQGVYKKKATTTPTIAPAMDICISSNLERLIYFLLENDGNRTRKFMEEFELRGELE